MKTIAIILTIVGCAAAQDIELYTAAVYMVQHRIGNDSSNRFEQNELLCYLQEAFGINDTMHQKILLDTKNMQAPAVHLNVDVIEAERLIAKDSNGKSDPFCILYLELTPEQRAETAVKYATLTPVWREKFQLKSKHADEETLCLEVWDFDPAQTIIEKFSKLRDVNSIQGLRKFATEPISAVPSVELIGSCRISFKDIPVIGDKKWYDLEKKGRLQNRGSVHLGLTFVDESNSRETIEEHSKLLGALSLSELKKELKYLWNGRFPAVAAAIILQDRARKGLLARNAELARWAAFATVHQTHPMHFGVLERLAGTLIQSIADRRFSEDEAALFWEGVKTILHSCFETIKGIEMLGNGKQTIAEQLKAIFGIISAISRVQVPKELDLFPIAMYDWLSVPTGTEIDYRQVLKHTVIKRGNVFWDRMVQNNAEIKPNDQAAIEYRLKIMSSVMAELKRAGETYDGIFVDKFNFPYAQTLYVTFEERLRNFDMMIVQGVCRRLSIRHVSDNDITELILGNKLFELYKNIQSFVEYGKTLHIDDLERTKISKYHGWFESCVRPWLNNVVTQAITSIKLEALNRTFGHLESVADSNVSLYPCAVDVTVVFNSLRIFWEELAWPNIEESFKYLNIIIPYVCRCSIGYAEMISAKFENMWEGEDENISGEGDEESEESISDGQEAFKVSPIWCTAINSIDHVKTAIGPWEKDHALQDVANPDDDENQRNANRRRRTFKRLIEDAIDYLDDKTEELLRLIANEMAPTMDEYLSDSAKMFETERRDHFINQLLYYISDNIEILHKNLGMDCFRRIAGIVWEILLKMLHQLVKSSLKEDRPPAFYSNLNTTLNTLVTGFSSIGANNAVSNVKLLEKIEPLLMLHSMETVELIDQYNIKRLEEVEDSVEPIHGILTVRARFVDNLLSVRIFNAMELRPSDVNGRNDTFVMLRLLPEEKFKELGTPKTCVRSNTLDPSFNEVLEMNLSPEQKSLEDAILVFEMRQKTDSVKTKFMAEAFLQFNEIPEETHERRVEFFEPKQLKLSRPGNTALYVVEILKYRKKDEKARKFLARLKEKEPSQTN